MTNANWPAGRPDPNVYFDVLSGPTPLSCPNGLVATITGTGGNDDLVGTAGDDVILGLGGNDRIAGLGGNDTICGGPGDDELYGVDGNDTLYGDAGNDKIAGGNGNDTLVGGAGTDRLTGDAGDDIIDAADNAGGDFSSAVPTPTGTPASATLATPPRRVQPLTSPVSPPADARGGR